MLQAVTRRWRFAFAAACVLAACSACHAGDVVLLLGNSPHDAEVQQIKHVTDFYGFALRPLQVKSSPDGRAALASLRSPQTLAAMVSQDALPGLDRDAVQAALQRPGGASVPLLVFGIVPGGDASLLTRWSGGAVESCGPLARNFRPDVLDVADQQFAEALAAVSLPAVASPACALSLKSGAQNLTLLTARGKNAAATTLARAEGNAANVFFAPQTETFDSSWIGKPRGLVKAFSSLAPYFLFLHAAAGDYAWHQPGRYANFTIDDPWLTEPYGQLNYAALLAEMEKHKFHTTIAFIPWNFDRSRADVVQLLRDHREQYSISIHGNDHAHREFGDYKDHSLEAQKADIRQAVARMERFRTLTGIPYDRFMVFPHFVAPKDTFAALGQYDFLGTANSVHVPDGEEFPADPSFLLRPFTSHYGGFLSFFRTVLGKKKDK